MSLNWAEKSSERKTESDVTDNSVDFLHRNEMLLSLLSICHSSFFRNYYRPQKKFAKVMFLHRSVSHYFHRESVCPSACWDTLPRARGRHPQTRGRHPLPRADTPWQQNPPKQPPPSRPPTAQCMLGDTGNKRAVRILLECILVSN